MDTLWSNIFKQPKKEEDEIISILKNIPVFRELGGRDLARVERILHRRTYKEGEIIFSQGDPGYGMYIIEKGSVGIVLLPSQCCVATLSEGEFFGELSLLDESPRSASAVAYKPCKILGFFQADLFELINHDPRAGVKITLGLARTLGSRLRHANESLHERQITEI